MQYSVIVSNLSYRTPDGQLLFENLNAVFGDELTGLVGRNGIGKTTLIKILLGYLHPSDGTVAIKGRFSVFSQSLHPAPGETIASLFGISEMLSIIQRAESGDAKAEELYAVDWLVRERAVAALQRFALTFPLDTAITRLSGGETTKVRLAALIFADPDFIVLDEPTNNLDAVGRASLISFLQGWKRGALVVSHDRTLLEHMDVISEVSAHSITRYGGNFSLYEKVKAAEREVAAQILVEAQVSVRKVAMSMRQRSERKQRRDARGHKSRLCADQPKMVFDSRKAQAEESGAKQKRLSECQSESAANALSEAKARFEQVTPVKVELSASGLSSGRRVLMVQNLAGGYAHEPCLFSNVTFEMHGPERVAISGGNGAGKTTLVKILTGQLAPKAGNAKIFVPYMVFDQATSLLDRARNVRENFKRLNPYDDENTCRAALARFRFRADGALQTVATLSGGEQLLAGLAVAIGGSTQSQLLILDEPTNHLDLDALSMLEAGLEAYDGSILVISHDRVFLERIGVRKMVKLTHSLHKAG